MGLLAYKVGRENAKTEPGEMPTFKRQREGDSLPKKNDYSSHRSSKKWAGAVSLN